MAKLYYKKITSGDIHLTTGVAWTVNDVPERWRAEVQELLDANGYNADAEPETDLTEPEPEPETPEEEPENTEMDTSSMV